MTALAEESSSKAVNFHGNCKVKVYYSPGQSLRQRVKESNKTRENQKTLISTF